MKYPDFISKKVKPIVDKIKYEGYPLRVEYFLTSRKGTKMIECLEILQEIGITYMIENGQKDNIRKKILYYVKNYEQNK